MDTPHYEQPPIDPSLKLLQRQAQEDTLAAQQADIEQINMRALQTYGARTAFGSGGTPVATPAPSGGGGGTASLPADAANLVVAALMSQLGR